jgi:hypothetical protein
MLLICGYCSAPHFLQRSGIDHDTYGYQTARPELMGQAVKRLERRWRTLK